MNWAVVFTDPARRDLKRLDRQVADRILAAIVRLAEAEQGDVKRLRSTGREWRLRVGDWRVIFTFEPSTQTLRVLRIAPRGRAYRR